MVGSELTFVEDEEAVQGRSGTVPSVLIVSLPATARVHLSPHPYNRQRPFQRPKTS
jgi:hypothetical protein